MIVSFSLFFGFITLNSTAATQVSTDDTWRRVTDLRGQRGDHAVVGLDRKFYIVGGHNGFDVTGYLEEYDPRTNEFHHMKRMTTARMSLAAAVLDHQIYAIGGTTGNEFLETVEVYDPNFPFDGWEFRSSMPTARMYLATAVVGGQLYSIGGYNGTDLSTTELYDPVTNEWTTRAPMPTARRGFAAAVVNGKIYAIGGQAYLTIQQGQLIRSGVFPLTNVEEYDPATDSWRSRTSMSIPRSHLATVAIGGRIYAIGGDNIDPQADNYIEEYDPAMDTWTNRAALPSSGNGHFTAVEVNGKIFAIRFGDAIYEYDPPFFDTDTDGIADDDELRYGFDPFIVDIDPINIDSDGDGRFNMDEVDRYMTDPSIADNDADIDRDDLTNVLEVDTYGTDPLVADSDLDGLKDGNERSIYGTNPLTNDTDNDSISDGQEILTYDTNPTEPDTDLDRLTDAEEINEYRTDPTMADTDGDTLDDATELERGTDPLDPLDPPPETISTVTEISIPRFSFNLGVITTLVVSIWKKRKGNVK